MTLLPAWLNLDVLSIIRLAALLLSLVITVYLLRVAKKSLATLFLAGTFFGVLLFNTASFFEFAGQYYWQPRTVRTVLVNLFNQVGPPLAMVFLLLFAYHFSRFRHAERREFRIVLGAGQETAPAQGSRATGVERRPARATPAIASGPGQAGSLCRSWWSESRR